MLRRPKARIAAKATWPAQATISLKSGTPRSYFYSRAVRADIGPYVTSRGDGLMQCCPGSAHRDF